MGSPKTKYLLGPGLKSLSLFITYFAAHSDTAAEVSNITRRILFRFRRGSVQMRGAINELILLLVLILIKYNTAVNSALCEIFFIIEIEMCGGRCTVE